MYQFCVPLDPLYRVNMPNFKVQTGGYGKNQQVHPITNIPFLNGTTYYNTPSSQQNYFVNNGGQMISGGSLNGRRRQQIRQQHQPQLRQGNRNDGYQLKVGGINSC